MDISPDDATFDEGLRSRHESFMQGQAPSYGAAHSLASPGTQQASAVQNAQVPRGFTPTSTLQPYMQSANGMSSSDYARMVPGQSKPMLSSNGSSQQSWDQDRMIKWGRFSATGPS